MQSGRFGPFSGVCHFGPLGRIVSALFHRWIILAVFFGELLGLVYLFLENS